MLPLALWPRVERAALRGVLFDIDDTLTTDGRLTAHAYAGVELLKSCGLIVVPVTGRPAGWCDHIARMWPVDGVVGENGAFFFRYDHGERRMVRRYLDDAQTRAGQRQRLKALGDEITSRVRGTALAADQQYRETDLAIDYCEDVPRLPAEAVNDIVRIMKTRGLSVKVSSIHVNGWFGDYDKLAMTRAFMRECHAIDLESEQASYAFVGDSPNDAPMFAFFSNAVGVANVCDFDGRIDTPPRYVTSGRAGAGFREAVDAILEARR